MSHSQRANNDFLQKLNEVLETNYQNESFGVSILAIHYFYATLLSIV